MNLARDLAGGVLVILVAGLIGIAQNAARDDSVPLIPRKANAVTLSSQAEPAVADQERATETALEEAGEIGDSYSPIPTDPEIVDGKVTMERLAELVEAGLIVLIDARSHAEFDEGHIKSAISFPYDELLGHYDELRENIPINADVVIYCESVTCDQSENLATELKLMGYERVVVYKGGWQEWEAAGLPTETSELEPTEH
jgi:rhodanese-related sulfurtransferase